MFAKVPFVGAVGKEQVCRSPPEQGANVPFGCARVT